ALALIAGLCATIPTAGASSRAHTAPAPTLPAHPDGLSRALASGRITPAKEALLRAQALFRPARVAALYGPVVPPAGRDATLAVAENVWSTEVGTMGYRAPLSDVTSTNHGPDGKLDIYLTNLGPQLYGYCTTDDPGLATPGTFTASAYCVVDNNFTEPVFQNH